ncbi:MAG: hypothetical protein HC789_02145 [Microcoleus sp. CSU_2_2]|nr:hypothetical protein [Microcoleus sp. SU_5_3]NJS09252.1 hypothetical protein [Microcoleus sp. CSU_2_2]
MDKIENDRTLIKQCIFPGNLGTRHCLNETAARSKQNNMNILAIVRFK